MKKIFFLIIIVSVVISCHNKKTKNLPVGEEGIPIVKSISKIIHKREFPINNFSKIEVVSYYDRIMWDTLEYKNEQPFRKVLVDNYKLTFDSTKIKERVILNKMQEKELLNLMICDTCVPEELSAACYKPRHMILFRDSKNRIIGYDEFCIECVGSRNSDNLNGFQKYCYSDMQELLKKFGITLFIESGDEKRVKEEIDFIENIQKSK
ncbi:hypothetical protein [Flavobacterium foetidum]|uniref:hypothetical protein n=1 Tax=Flavobacterium foetidum TaxID=2026681 RepID=UPI001074C1ED|nr:hypothetical protein [Flavobacterium foetidum]KAF2517728.1 hypothetical protein E0W73_00550 [Flavobacterium foetidum]